MYKALYRSYRPQTFFDVVGQHHITQTFQNAILQQKFTHAYLISGPRGTGKTTLAKIFAKAVNCLNLQPNAEPCNQCAVCTGVNDGSLSDIVEIDAASNNGVDEIRELREKAKYAPTLAKYKVYIIDEVHMLSTGAFNALLKTLEEPPKHVIFVLATTELHKIPVTIISRCQRFEVKKMTELQIVERLNYVLTQEAIEFEQEAMTLIARLSDGGMRDALSLLDQVISYCSERIRLNDVYDVAGIATSEQVKEFLLALNEQNDQQVLTVIEQLFESGKDLNQFIEQLLLLLRDILIAKTQTSQQKELLGLAKSFELSFFYQAIETFNACQHQMKYTSFPRLLLETTAIRFMYPSEQHTQVGGQAAHTRVDPGMQKKIHLLQETVQELREVVEQLQKEFKQQPSIEQKIALPVIEPEPQQPAYLEQYQQVYRILAQATLTKDTQSLVQIQQVWPTIQKQATQPELGFLLDSHPRAAISEGCVLATRFQHVKDQLEQPAVRQRIEMYLSDILGKNQKYVVILEAEWQQLREQFAQKWRNQEVTPELLNKLPRFTEEKESHQQQDEALDLPPTNEEEQLSFLADDVQQEEQNDIIAVATDLFGDIVEVI
ncbi:MAG: DNA polymerase III subunit gamma/tau [Culicoidibacterales bacterium]